MVHEYKNGGKYRRSCDERHTYGNHSHFHDRLSSLLASLQKVKDCKHEEYKTACYFKIVPRDPQYPENRLSKCQEYNTHNNSCDYGISHNRLSFLFCHILRHRYKNGNKHKHVYRHKERYECVWQNSQNIFHSEILNRAAIIVRTLPFSAPECLQALEFLLNGPFGQGKPDEDNHVNKRNKHEDNLYPGIPGFSEYQYQENRPKDKPQQSKKFHTTPPLISILFYLNFLNTGDPGEEYAHDAYDKRSPECRPESIYMQTEVERA